MKMFKEISLLAMFRVLEPSDAFFRKRKKEVGLRSRFKKKSH